MKDNLHRLFLLLAALDVPPSEARNLLRRACELSPYDLHVKLSSLKQPRDYGDVEEVDSLASQRRLFDDGGNLSVGRRVERLLRNEAGLGTQAAVEMLSRRLVQHGVVASPQIPPLSRKSLEYWINRLISVVPEKEILRQATILRNELVHQRPPDWSLSKPDK